MRSGPDIAGIASLIGDPGRANMLTALMAGKALTATELAAEAGISRQTASSHIAQLEAGGLVAIRRQGRHAYVSLARDEVAQVLESLMGLAAGSGQLRSRTGPREQALREARVCYNHLAGERGTQLHDAMIAAGHLQLAGDGGLAMTPSGKEFAAGLGIDIEARGRSPLCRPCLDWSERRSHLGGRLGRALMHRMEASGWLRREPGSRAVTFTASGAAAFDRAFPQPLSAASSRRGTPVPSPHAPPRLP